MLSKVPLGAGGESRRKAQHAVVGPLTGAELLTYGIAKGLQYALVVAVALTINFALPRLAPGDPVDYLLGDQAVQLSEEQQAEILAQFELDKPVPEQFADYVGGLLTGDLGTSVRFGQPVTDVLLERLPYTLLLVGASIVLATVIGTALGVFAAWKRGRGADIGSLSVVMFLDATPIFWLGMVLLGVFAVQFGLFPVFGATGPGDVGAVAFGIDIVERSVLPVTTLTLGTLGAIFLTARYSMIATLREDYLTMGEAVGLSERRLLFGHAMRNSLLPISTMVMLQVAFLFSGAVVVETVFSYPGLGRLVYDSVLARDYPLLQGAFLLLALGVIVANYVSDLLYPLLDPRVRRPAPGEAPAR